MSTLVNEGPSTPWNTAQVSLGLQNPLIPKPPLSMATLAGAPAFLAVLRPVFAPKSLPLRSLRPIYPLKTQPLRLLVAQSPDWTSQGEDSDGLQGVAVATGVSDWEETADDVEAAAEGEVEEEEGYSEPNEEAKVFVGNIPYDMDSEGLAKVFEEAGIVEVAEVVYNRQTDQSRGFGFVTMSTVEEAEKAVEMFHRYEINGRLLTVNKAAPRGARVERTFQPSNRMYIGNLPWQVDDARLEQVFSEHGKVLDAKVVYDRESGRSRGFGFVTMASQSEMDDAIAALDGQSLDGRAIRVNVAEERPRRSSF